MFRYYRTLIISKLFLHGRLMVVICTIAVRIKMCLKNLIMRASWMFTARSGMISSVSRLIRKAGHSERLILSWLFQTMFTVSPFHGYRPTADTFFSVYLNMAI